MITLELDALRMGDGDRDEARVCSLRFLWELRPERPFPSQLVPLPSLDEQVMMNVWNRRASGSKEEEREFYEWLCDAQLFRLQFVETNSVDIGLSNVFHFLEKKTNREIEK